MLRALVLVGLTLLLVACGDAPPPATAIIPTQTPWIIVVTATPPPTATAVPPSPTPPADQTATVQAQATATALTDRRASLYIDPAGQIVHADNGHAVVSAGVIAYRTTIGTTAAGPGLRFAVLAITVANADPAPLAVNPLDFTVQASDENTTPAAAESFLLGGNALTVVKLQQGAHTSGGLLFRIGNGAYPLYLNYQPLGEAVIQLDLTLPGTPVTP